MERQKFFFLFSFVSITICAPCSDIRTDKNDGLNIFGPKSGIFKDYSSMYKKRDTYQLSKLIRDYKIATPEDEEEDLSTLNDIPFRPLFAYRALKRRRLGIRSRRSADGSYQDINDNLLYSDDNSLITTNYKVFLPLYVLRTKNFVKRRQARDLSHECSSEFFTKKDTSTDFYARKPWDIKSAEIPAETGDDVTSSKDDDDDPSRQGVKDNDVKVLSSSEHTKKLKGENKNHQFTDEINQSKVKIDQFENKTNHSKDEINQNTDQNEFTIKLSETRDKISSTVTKVNKIGQSTADIKETSSESKEHKNLSKETFEVAESSVVFHPLFAIRQRSDYKNSYRGYRRNRRV